MDIFCLEPTTQRLVASCPVLVLERIQENKLAGGGRQVDAASMFDAAFAAPGRLSMSLAFP